MTGIQLRHDLLLHRNLGFVICIAVSVVLAFVDGIHFASAVLLGVLAACIAGEVKERIYDRRTPGHTEDRVDSLSTAGGAAYGAALLGVGHWLAIAAKVAGLV